MLQMLTKHHTSNNILDYTMYRLVEAETHQNIYQISYATNHNRMKQEKYNFVYLLDHFVMIAVKVNA